MSGRHTLKDFAALRETMESRWGETFPFDQQMWTLCNERARRLLETRDWGGMRVLYLHMAEYLGREGRDCFCVLEEAARARLLELRDAGAAEARIACRDDACAQCLRRHGDIVDIEEALVSMPLPHPGCSRSDPHAANCTYCRCEYRPAAP